jgi:mRNA interferase HigB
MRLVGRSLLHDFMTRHADSRSWLRTWTKEVEAANWRSPRDIKKQYASASVIDEQTVIFNVKGNAYRMEVKVSFVAGVVMVVRLGTHGEYGMWKY